MCTTGGLFPISGTQPDIFRPNDISQTISLQFHTDVTAPCVFLIVDVIVETSTDGSYFFQPDCCHENQSSLNLNNFRTTNPQATRCPDRCFHQSQFATPVIVRFIRFRSFSCELSRIMFRDLNKSFLLKGKNVTTISHNKYCKMY